MFGNVLVGVDGLLGGRDAIGLAKQLAAPHAHITLAHVYGGDLMRGRGGALMLAPERENSQRLLACERTAAPFKADVTMSPEPSVGRGLHELAESRRADLVVVGSCRRGLVGRVFVEDDTRDALNGAACAVAVAPSGYSDRSIILSEIGVGYNGSPESEQALAVARELAAERGAKLSAFEALSLPAYLFGSDAGPVDESIPTSVDQARQRIAALGVEPHAAYGTAAEELALYGASVDLLVIGSRGYGPIGRLVHGSTSQQLTRTARCPLLVLARALHAGEAPGTPESGRETAAAA